MLGCALLLQARNIFFHFLQTHKDLVKVPSEYAWSVCSWPNYNGRMNARNSYSLEQLGAQRSSKSKFPCHMRKSLNSTLDASPGTRLDVFVHASSS